MKASASRARLWRLLRPHSGILVAGFLAAALASTLQGVSFLILDPLLKELFGEGLGVGGGSWLERTLPRLLSPLIGGAVGTEAARRLVALFLVVLAIKVVAGYLSAYLSVVAQENVARDLRLRLWTRLLRLDLGVFQQTRGGQVAAALVTDADQVKQLIVAALAAFFQNLVLIVVLIATMIGYSWRLTLLVLLLAPVLVAAVQSLRARIKRHARGFTHERGELTARVTERLGAMKLIRAFGAEEREAVGFEAQVDRYRKGAIRTQRFALLTSPFSELFGGAMVMLVIWAAANPSVLGTQLAVSSMLVFVLMAAQVMTPIKAMADVPTKLAIAEASADRIFAFLDMPETERDGDGARRATFENDLVFDHVSFSYDPGAPVLKEISFRVGKGEVVALVGPSGGGKTTLLELVSRFRDPGAGEIRLDGVPLPLLQRHSLRSLQAVVSQDTILLHDTVRANIAYGRPTATDDEVIAAAQAANAHEFIVQLTDRYDTLLGERGTRLSGGQRQRIAIARALLQDAPILILDEATSALDTESERLVQEAIERLMRDRTVLVIAHRLATIREADRIVVLEEGRIVEMGTHAELYAAGRLYRRLHDLQFSAAEVAR